MHTIMLCSYLAAATAGFQQGDSVPRFDLMRIVVTAPRTSIPLAESPAATSVVDRSHLLTMPRTIAVDEAIRLVPGVKVDNQADGERVHMSIRGQGILSERGLRGIKVLLDGIPLNDPTGFASDLYDVDWSNIERAEVLRGPGAAMYGGGSTAGVLNLITTRPGERAGGLAEVRGGSHGFWKSGVRTNGTVSGAGYQLSASRTMGDGYREHTAFAGTNLYARAVVPAGNLMLRPVIGWTTFFNENAEGLNLTWLAQNRRQANPDAITFNELQRTERLTAGLGGDLAISTNTNATVNVFARRTQYREPVPSSVQHRTLKAPGVTLQLNHHVVREAAAQTLGIGTDVQWQTIDEYRRPNLGQAREGNELLSNESIHQSGIGVFLFDRIEVGKRWNVLLNVRYDRIANKLNDVLRSGGVDLSGEQRFDRATARVGLAYVASPSLSFYGNWGQGFLPPATEELANNPAAAGGFNTNLQPALSHGEELGVRGYATAALMFDVALFHLDTNGDFDRYRIAARPLETFYRNGGNSRRFGAEAYTRWMPMSKVQLEAAYTWSHFRYLSSTSFYGDIRNHSLPNSPEHQLTTELTLDVIPRLSLGAGSDSYSRSYIDAGNARSVKGYTLWNAEASWRTPLNATVMLQGRNLTGTKYIAFTEPDPDGNSYQPGPEREVFIGLRVAIQ